MNGIRGIRLRAPEPEDLDVMREFENDSELWETGTATGPFSRYQLKTYIAENRNDVFADRQLRLMIEQEEGGVVGIIDLCTFDPRHNRAEVGVVIRKDRRRQGIAREALALLERHCFGLLGIHQLYAYVRCDNEASKRLFLSMGYVESGCFTDWMRVGTEYYSVILYQKLESQFKEGKRGYFAQKR